MSQGLAICALIFAVRLSSVCTVIVKLRQGVAQASCGGWRMCWHAPNKNLPVRGWWHVELVSKALFPVLNQQTTNYLLSHSCLQTPRSVTRLIGLLVLSNIPLFHGVSVKSYCSSHYSTLIETLKADLTFLNQPLETWINREIGIRGSGTTAGWETSDTVTMAVVKQVCDLMFFCCNTSSGFGSISLLLLGIKCKKKKKKI